MTLFIVLFLLLVAIIIYIISGNGSDREYYSPGGAVNTDILPGLPTQSGADSAENGVQITSAPVVTPIPTPIPTPEPTPTPSPTPEPTPTPIPVGTLLGNGSFTSDTGTYLNIRADWAARVEDESNISVTVDVFSTHYALHSGSFRTLFIRLNGQYEGLYTPDIQYDDNILAETPMGSYTFLVPLAPGQTYSDTLGVEWHFGGFYGNQQLDVLECGGPIMVQR